MSTRTPDPTKFALIRMDEWEALYVDGKSVSQDHEHNPIQLLLLAETFGFTHSTLAVLEPSMNDQEKCMEIGNFPQYLSEFESCNP